MNDSLSVSDSAAESGSDAPETYRLVIRAQVIADLPPQSSEQHWPKHARAWVLAVLVALLVSGLIVFSLFRSDSPSSSATNTESQNAGFQSPATARTSGDQSATQVKSPLDSQSSSDATASSTKISPVKSLRDEFPRPTREVVPDAPRSALQTIRGTVRVAVRVTIDKQGTVIDASTEDPGPSRYFERLSLDAAKKWIFTESVADRPRTMLVRFHFTRNGVTARSGMYESNTLEGKL